MKNILQVFAILIFWSVTVFSARAQNPTESQPNILWITIEDTSPHFIGCYGNKGVKTPHIDQLAKEGVLFSNAYSTNTVCAPSRFTILTGVRSSTAGTGNHRTHYNIPKEITGFPFLLKSAGYYTTNNVKTDYNLGREKEMISQNWSESSNKADHRNRKVGQPFFSVYNFNDSHQSRTMTNPHAWYVENVLNQIPVQDRAKPEDVIVPPFYRDFPEMREQMMRLYNSLHLTDIKVGELIARLKSEGIYENTIIFFFGDHGQGMPGFKTHASSLGHKVPFIVRVPAKYQHLVPAPAGSVHDGSVDFQDLAPTMLSLVGRAIPAYMNGTVFLGPSVKAPFPYFWGARDNTDEVIDLGRTVIRDSLVYVRNYYPHLPIIQRHKYMDVSDILRLIRKEQKDGRLNALQASIVHGGRDAESLFNIKQDPWETTNLASRPGYEVLLKEMRKANQEAILKNRDVMFAPEFVLAQVNKQDTLYRYGQDESRYPLAHILDAAETVGKGNAYQKTQIKLLRDKNSVVRYWAAVGLHNQKKNDLREKELLQAMQKEQEHFVKIELASTISDHFQHLDARAVLVSYIDHDNPELVRQALRAAINSLPIDNQLADKSLALRIKLAANPFKSLNYEINSCIDLILDSAGLETLTNEK